MSKRGIKKPYWEMSVDELREATKEFEKPIPVSKMRPLAPPERRHFQKAQKRGVRPVFVKRSRPKKVTLQLDAELLTRSAEYASQRHMTLSEVVERSLRSALNFVR